MNRFWLYFALAAAIVGYGQWADASEPTLTDHVVYDHEGAFRIKTIKGRSFICLLTVEGNGFTKHIDPSNQVALTCSPIGEGDLSWRFCIGGFERLSCNPPATGVGPRPKPDVRMGLTR